MVRRLEPHVQRVHLDVIDGKFADNKTISGWKELLEIKTPLAFDVHLMVTNPAKQMEQWYKTSADRFIIHAEVEDDILPILIEMEQNGKRRAIALNPGTPVEKITSMLPHLDFIQFMTVKPGFYGSPFEKSVLEPLEMFSMAHPNIPIAVDGGITPETARLVRKAGATILVCGTYIAKSDDVASALRALENSSNS